MTWSAERLVAPLMAAAIILLGLAPLAMPDSYSWIGHTTSESAAQNVTGAWIARLGFVSMALGVMARAWAERAHWNQLTAIAHVGFAVCMFGAAAFSSKPWFDAQFDATQDTLHSVAASVMGVAFALGVVSSLFDRLGRRRPVRLVDAAAVLASVLIPLAMFNLDGGAGLLQRIMFGVAFWWYLTIGRARPSRV